MERYLEYFMSRQKIYINTYIYPQSILKKTMLMKTYIESRSGKIYVRMLTVVSSWC